MASWGITLLILGLGSFLMNQAGMEFILLIWVDQWGQGIGTAIRLGVAAFGALLLILSAVKSKQQGG